MKRSMRPRDRRRVLLEVIGERTGYRRQCWQLEDQIVFPLPPTFLPKMKSQRLQRKWPGVEQIRRLSSKVTFQRCTGCFQRLH